MSTPRRSCSPSGTRGTARPSRCCPTDVDFRAQIESEWRVDGASGAISDERLSCSRARAVRRPGAAVDARRGSAATPCSGDAEHARDLYAAAAAAWHDAGHVRSRRVRPGARRRARRRVVPAQLRRRGGLGDARDRRRSLRPESEPHGAPTTSKRSAQLDRAARSRDGLDAAVAELLGPSQRDATTSCVEEWRGTWDEEQFVHFVAERDGEVVAHILLYKRPHDLRVPRDSIDLANASTFPEARGTGAGVALTEHVLALGARERVPDDGHGLANDESARVSLLAEARLPPDVPAAVPSAALTELDSR